MNSIKVVIADDNSIIREILKDAFNDEPDIEIAAVAENGFDTIEYIKKYEPDIVLLDLVMPVVDGMGVMEEIRSCDNFRIKPYFIIISAAGREDIVSQALETGASYFYMKPFNEKALIKKIRKICTADNDNKVYIENEPHGRNSSNSDMENYISDILRKTGIPVKMVGYKYLKEAISVAVYNPETSISVTKDVYPRVADKFDTSSGNVERNIRYVIESAWNRINERQSDSDILSILGDTSRKPTNSVFILSCSEWIRYNVKNI